MVIDNIRSFFRRRSGARFPHILAFLLLASSASGATAAPEDCIGKSPDGLAICTGQAVTPWNLGVCIEENAFMVYEHAWCGAAGGVWIGGDYGGYCSVSPHKTPLAEAEIVPMAIRMFQQLHPACSPPVATPSGPGWRGPADPPIPSSFCWGGGLSQSRGVEDGNLFKFRVDAMVPDSSGACAVPVSRVYMGLKGRAVMGCPRGTRERIDADGKYECFAIPPDCTATSNPIRVANGERSLTETDAAIAGPHPLASKRYFTNHAEFSPTGEASDGITAFGFGWRSHYDRNVWPGPASSTVLAIARRATGALHYFGPDGRERLNTQGGADRVERLVDASGVLMGWRLHVAADDSVEEYDAQSRLLALVDRSGLRQTLTWSDGTATPPNGATMLSRPWVPVPAGLLLRVTDAVGRTLAFDYDYASGAPRVARVTDPAGRSVNYEYVAEGRQLTRVVYPDATLADPADNPARRFSYQSHGYYQADGNLTAITDELGNAVASYGYQTNQYVYQGAKAHLLGAALTSNHAGADSTAVAYVDDLDRIRTVTDARGTTRTLTFETIAGVKRLVSQSQPGGAGCGPAAEALGYDAAGNVASRKDFNGNLTCYSHDTQRNLETLRIEGLSGTGTCAAPVARSETRTVATTWWDQVAPGRLDPFRLPRIVAEYAGAAATGTPLRRTEYAYDDHGNVTLKRVTDPATGAVRTWTWTHAYSTLVPGLLIQKVEDGPRTDVADLTTWDYFEANDSCLGCRGNLERVTNALGHVTRITRYNANGQVEEVVGPDGLVTTLVYDERGRLISRSVGAETTTYRYDAAGQLTRATLPDGSFLDYGYDLAHRLISVADSLGNRIDYTLDVSGNRTREDVKDPAGTLARTRSREYDALNRLFRDIGGADPANQRTEYGYDAGGNLTQVTAPLGRVTNNAYDALNRRVETLQPPPAAGQARPRVAYGYDGLDQLRSVTDPRNLVTTYTLDALGNQAQLASPDSGLTARSFDAAGNLATSTDAKGQVTTYTWDALNRVTEVRLHDGSKEIHQYDQGTNGIGRLTALTELDPAGVQQLRTAYTYDGHGRVATTAVRFPVNPSDFVTGYQYDAGGRLTRITYPSARQVDYAYDAQGRVREIATGTGGPVQTVATQVSYHPFGPVKGWLQGNGQTYSRSFDLDGRIAGYTLGARSYALDYDAGSRIVGLREPAVPANAIGFGYDAIDRLVSAGLPNSTSYGFGYDAVGNRTSRSVNGTPTSYGYGATSNRLADIGGAPLAADANGSLVAIPAANLTYDTRGRLRQATTGAGTTAYQVAASGQRVRKSGAGGETLFHYDTGGRLIAETTASGQVIREHLYLGDVPVAVAK